MVMKERGTRRVASQKVNLKTTMVVMMRHIVKGRRKVVAQLVSCFILRWQRNPNDNTRLTCIFGGRQKTRGFFQVTAEPY